MRTALLTLMLTCQAGAASAAPSEYSHSPLCARAELTLWTCEKRTSMFSLCASPVVTRSTGYLQYRASKHGKLVFEYPAVKRPPAGLFTYDLSPSGNASLSFASAGYRYTLSDPLRAPSSIVVAAAAPSSRNTEIACGPNQTLQLNTTMELMGAAGVAASD